ncbi:FixH family protein [Pseudoxanthomonas sp.]|uniref:FixH family protein n=1 Tax=Pseudoxanthomonas sp. TaxID=1871049 RepID=UPI003F7F774F
MTPQPKVPLWRIPAMWLVIGLPLASIVAGLGLVYISVRAGGADPVTDKVDRMAQIQTTDLGPDQRAQAMKLAAVLRVDAGVVEVIPVNGEFDRRAPLELHLQHPTRAEEDRRLRLPPAGNGWRLDEAVDASHAWKVQLGPADGQWRLRGRLPKAQRAVHLAPSLQDDAAS